MLDPFTGWLSYVDLLLAVVASIFAKLEAIVRHVSVILCFVLSMMGAVRRFRCKSTVPVRPRKRVGRGRAKLHGPTDPSTPT